MQIKLAVYILRSGVDKSYENKLATLASKVVECLSITERWEENSGKQPVLIENGIHYHIDSSQKDDTYEGCSSGGSRDIHGSRPHILDCYGARPQDLRTHLPILALLPPYLLIPISCVVFGPSGLRDPASIRLSFPAPG